MLYFSTSLLKICAASSVMGIIARESYQYLSAHINSTMGLLMAVFIGCTTYLSMLYLMKLKELHVLILEIKNKVRLVVTQTHD
ncbi:hypothetical protein GCM10008932_07440 [Alkalibacterium iburiense]|uniref:Uncharacterized protein n=1 Tax=Alkalibacterium iburiense TaxID=290589 RepID=A0ABN0X7G7_9LACT